jgi:hypothetical protein
MMRGVLQAITSLMLLQAFLMAPFQHVHLGNGHHAHGEGHESPMVHSHFYSAISAEAQPTGASLDHSHQAHASLSLDTFTTLPHAALIFALEPEAEALVYTPAQSDVFTETIEPRGHDPPRLEGLAPRAPPL